MIPSGQQPNSVLLHPPTSNKLSENIAFSSDQFQRYMPFFFVQIQFISITKFHRTQGICIVLFNYLHHKVPDYNLHRHQGGCLDCTRMDPLTDPFGNIEPPFSSVHLHTELNTGSTAQPGHSGSIHQNIISVWNGIKF